MSRNPVPTINNADQTLDWFSSIDRCFSWNDRLEQRHLPEAAAAQWAGAAVEAAARAAGMPSAGSGCSEGGSS